MQNDNIFRYLHCDSLDDFHFGRLIEEEAKKKQVSPKQLSMAIFRYQNNERKIFRLADIDEEDAVKISYLLEYNLLERLSKSFLSHLPPVKSKLSIEKHTVTFNLKVKTYDLHGNTGKCDFIEEVDFGKYLKGLAKQYGWSEKQVSEKLQCTQSTISYLYGRKSIKLKKMVQISNVFQHNLIAELYLSRMMVVHPLKIFDQCWLTVINDNICLEKPEDKTCTILFRPK